MPQTKASYIISDDPDLGPVCREFSNKPITVSARVLELIKGQNRSLSVTKTILNDILWMSRNYVIEQVDANTRVFQVVIPGPDPDHEIISPNGKLPVYDLVIVEHPLNVYLLRKGESKAV